MSNVDLPKQDTVANAFTLDAFNSDVQAKIAGKMRTTDLARMRVTSLVPSIFWLPPSYCLKNSRNDTRHAACRQ